MGNEKDALLAQYRNKISEYKRQWHLVRRLAAGGRTPANELQEADAIRDGIHKDLRGLARELGKSSAEVDIDLLSEDGDLREYNLPEFRLVKPWTTLENIELEWVQGGDVLRQDVVHDDLSDRRDVMRQTEVFIPFGEEEAWHLFDEERFLSRDAEDLERRRRAMKAVGLLGGKGKYVQFETRETFHRGTAFFGIAFCKEDIHYILGRLAEFREMVSIDRSLFSPERIREDAGLILEDDLRRIMAHRLAPTEDREYLVRRYIDSRMTSGGIDEPFVDILKKQLHALVEHAKDDDLRKEVEDEEKRAATV